LAHIAAYPAYVVGLWAGLVINCFGCEAAKSETNVWKFSTGQRIIYMTFQGRKKKKRSDLIVMELEGLTVDQRRMCGIHY